MPVPVLLSVSILTGPEGPVLLPQVVPAVYVWILFQSSPAPKGRCYGLEYINPGGASEFQSSPAPKGRCYVFFSERNSLVQRFQSSPAPKGRCYATIKTGALFSVGVFQSSPAPKGRCYHPASPKRPPSQVSILTGPEGPVLLIVVWPLVSAAPFQSSPAPKGRCYHRLRLAELREVCFNPHRPRRAGATRRLRDAVEAVLQFQSSPAPKGRCYPSACRCATAANGFNPHRPRRAGATLGSVRSVELTHGVSILTGPEGPVLPAPSNARQSARSCFNPHRPRRAGATASETRSRPVTSSQFQSSPAPKGRCYDAVFESDPVWVRFNPHRPRRAGATPTASTTWPTKSSFNPHRPRRAGATVGFHRKVAAELGYYTMSGRWMGKRLEGGTARTSWKNGQSLRFAQWLEKH